MREDQSFLTKGFPIFGRSKIETPVASGILRLNPLRPVLINSHKLENNPVGAEYFIRQFKKLEEQVEGPP
jgi:hypothetical protein